MTTPHSTLVVLKAISGSLAKLRDSARPLLRTASPSSPRLAVGSAVRETTPVILLVLAAAWIYTPWHQVPLPIQDFSEFLPVLLRSDSLRAAFDRVASYYWEQGRVHFVTELFIAVSWEAFGTWSGGWDALRFGLMSTIVVMGYVVYRQIVGDRFAAFCGAAVLVVATPAAAAWLRLTGEPLALASLLISLQIAVGYQKTSRWRVAAVAFGLMMVLGFGAKEPTVVLFPCLALIACVWHPRNGFVPAVLTARNRWLCAIVGLVSFVLLVPVLWVRHVTPPLAYAHEYGVGAVTLTRFLKRAFVIFLPVSTGSSESVILAAGAALAFVGLAAAVRAAPRKRHPLRDLALALILTSAVGAVAYLPWPRFEPFYALPFLIGPSFAVAYLLSTLEAGATGRNLAMGFFGVSVAIAGSEALRLSRETAALRRLHADAVHVIRRAAPQSTVSLATRANMIPAQDWQGVGPTIGRFAASTAERNSAMARVEDVSCEAADSLWQAQNRKDIIVTFNSDCAAPGPLIPLSRQPYNYFDWTSASVVADTMTLDLYAMRITRREAGAPSSRASTDSESRMADHR